MGEKNLYFYIKENQALHETLLISQGNLLPQKLPGLYTNSSPVLPCKEYFPYSKQSG